MIHLNRIKKLCKSRNLTLKKAASELGMTEQSLHKIIKTNSTKIETLITISEYFNIDPIYFFDSQVNEDSDSIRISKQEFNGLIKKVIAYSIHGFGMIKLEWNKDQKKFETYFDILEKQYTPEEKDIEYLSSLQESKIEVTEETTPIDLTKLLMTKDEYDFTSTYYSSIKKMQLQEELYKLTTFIDRYHVKMTNTLKQEIQDLKDRIKYYESKSIIGKNQ
ncbi:helix-turn-helix domain-containing protein [Dysgonomonas sp. 25]|uniref:helix-turn-helix domain-containing protein n=1 Tax=Dysgonomonas sp. 25 TaxID=2302933 RepID=UPI0013D4F6C5|nr:helix-turn-helix transcriptional regulator [Dysgonomonas sp. 25]NDV67892.1 XRE family transcriptional regulator [Dysgonomonas sp. 25]